MMKKKRILLIAAIIILVGLVLPFHPIKTNIKLDTPGMLLFPDGRSPVPCQVQLSGQRSYYALDGRTFLSYGSKDLSVDGVPVDGYYFYGDFSVGADYFQEGANLHHWLLSRKRDLFLCELGYNGQGCLVDGFDALLDGSVAPCLLVFPAGDMEQALALTDKALALPRDDLDWLRPYLT